jgi:hypothetical protein
LQSFETEMLTEEENFAGLARINRELIGRAEAVDAPWRVVAKVEFHLGELFPRVGFRLPRLGGGCVFDLSGSPKRKSWFIRLLL